MIRAQFASEIGCADVKLAKRSTWYAESNPHQYKVTGCGVVRSYTCTEEQAAGLISYDEPACTWVEGDADAPKMKAQPSMEDDAMDDMDAPPDDAPPADDMDAPSEPSSDEGDDGLGADADGEAETHAAPTKAKAKVKAKGGFKLGAD